MSDRDEHSSGGEESGDSSQIADLTLHLTKDQYDALKKLSRDRFLGLAPDSLPPPFTVNYKRGEGQSRFFKSVGVAEQAQLDTLAGFGPVALTTGGSSSSSSKRPTATTVRFTVTLHKPTAGAPVGTVVTALFTLHKKPKKFPKRSQAPQAATSASNSSSSSALPHTREFVDGFDTVLRLMCSLDGDTRETALRLIKRLMLSPVFGEQEDLNILIATLKGFAQSSSGSAGAGAGKQAAKSKKKSGGLNGWSLFMSENFSTTMMPEDAAELQSESMIGEVSKELSKQWRDLTDEEKAVWHNKAAERYVYNLGMCTYIATYIHGS